MNSESFDTLYNCNIDEKQYFKDSIMWYINVTIGKQYFLNFKVKLNKNYL